MARRCLTAIGVFGLIGFAIRFMPAVFPSGDAAAISLRTIDALHGSVYVGAYSQFWDHPGPMLFYALAPLYAVSGYHDLSIRVTALIINAGALALVGYIASRYGRPALTLTALIALLVVEIRAGGDMMFSAWNPHAPLLAIAALMVVVAAVWAGESAFAPAVALLASFVAQSHVGFAPLALSLMALTVYALCRTAGARVALRVLTRTVLVLAALWFLPLVEQLRDRPGNMTRIISYFAAVHGAPISLSGSSRLFARYYLLPFTAGLRLPTGDVAVFGSGPFVVGVALVAAALIYGVIAERGSDRFGRRLCAVCLFSTTVGFVATTRLSRPVSDHTVFWVSIVGAMSVASAVARIADRMALTIPSWMTGRRILTSSVALFIVVAGFRMHAWFVQAVRDRTPALLFDEIHRLVPSDEPVVILQTQRSWEDVVGVVLQGAKRGRRIAVSPSLVDIAGANYAPSGAERVQILVFDPDVDPDVPENARRHVAGRVERFDLAFQSR
jgi:hypothetical protein